MALAAVKSILRPVLKDSFAWDIYLHMVENRSVESWKQDGEPAPPPHAIKERIVATYGSQFGTKTLIETGTYLGDMLYAVRRQFTRLVSIELSSELCRKARERFQRFPRIEIVQGDSAEVLPKILDGIAEPCLFWLDGHYSGGFTAKASLDTPILKELETIFEHPVKDHVILIDDARLFNGTEDYPAIGDVRQLVERKRPDYEFSVSHDVIRIHPKREGLRIEF